MLPSQLFREIEIRTIICNTTVDLRTYPASIWGVGSIGLAIAAINMALARMEMIC